MSDPRNVQHDKKVIQEKIHRGEDLTSGAAHVPQPGKKTPAAAPKPSHKAGDDDDGDDDAENPTMRDGQGVKGQ